MKSQELTFKLTKILKAKKNNGYIKNKLGVKKSKPTWTYPESRENFTLTLEGEETLEKIEHEKN
jgi:hypothetical protein